MSMESADRERDLVVIKPGENDKSSRPLRVNDSLFDAESYKAKEKVKISLGSVKNANKKAVKEVDQFEDFRWSIKFPRINEQNSIQMTSS